MKFIIQAVTDVGTVKKSNQDSLTVKTLHTRQGKMVFACICDGMGGFDKGEIASTTVVQAFHEWVIYDLPVLCRNEINGRLIRNQWERLIQDLNRKIMNYANDQGIRMGTTLTALLITQQEYYIVNVGDTRAYQISDQRLELLTEDQTLVMREVKDGHLTLEQAREDSRRNILLQCVGASRNLNPEYLSGKPVKGAVYMLCSDGFRHEISESEIQNSFSPSLLLNAEEMLQNSFRLIELNKQRKEKDNISVILIRTF